MTELENGGKNIADENGGNDADVNNDGGKMTDVQKQIEEMKAQIDTLRKESAGKDQKITQFLKEKEQKEFAQKTEQEKLEEYKKRVEAYEQREAFRQSFKDAGLNPDDFQGIVNEKDPKVQAQKFAELLKLQKEKSAAQAIEDFKLKELEKQGPTPKPTNNSEVDASKKYFTKYLEAANN